MFRYIGTGSDVGNLYRGLSGFTVLFVLIPGGEEDAPSISFICKLLEIRIFFPDFPSSGFCYIILDLIGYY
jgi:hypothetical protein